MAKPDPAEIERIINRPYTIELEYGDTPEEGVAAYVAEWPGCITAGDSREEALTHIGDAMYDWVEGCLAEGFEIPEPLKEYGGTVVVKMPKTLHRDIAKRAEHEDVSMNQWIVSTVARAIGTPASSRGSSSPSGRRAPRSARATAGPPRRSARRR